ncbi:hypothetical protein I309_06597 [Cryptococcus deuterogattii LA55]|nr:hypothetical protein I309_06597 [Cryptococcus deuterogattii LA55]KIR91883.1 hypothetical protein I304_04045 [Cryptococcus deuterogattii CBS 10090]
MPYLPAPNRLLYSNGTLVHLSVTWIFLLVKRIFWITKSSTQGMLPRAEGQVVLLLSLV